MIPTFAQIIHRRNNLSLIVGYDPHLFQVDCGLGQRDGKKIRVGVLCAPGKNLVADHQHGSGGIAHMSPDLVCVPPNLERFEFTLNQNSNLFCSNSDT